MVDISRCDQKERDSARKECSILGALKHPNIIEYRESFEEKGQVLRIACPRSWSTGTLPEFTNLSLRLRAALSPVSVKRTRAPPATGR